VDGWVRGKDFFFGALVLNIILVIDELQLYFPV
jgi:hypothetical protein